ncbi:hypothetical protein [Sphingomonas bacterium]|uniref:hypothetical protein n=1 Tax=Sphingomonas bacterium TaxID=1895847 RepID=UPI001575313F|nr:hypothetical protein [Sphingomonas bacterium]
MAQAAQADTPYQRALAAYKHGLYATAYNILLPYASGGNVATIDLLAISACRLPAKQHQGLALLQALRMKATGALAVQLTQQISACLDGVQSPTVIAANNAGSQSTSGLMVPVNPTLAAAASPPAVVFGKSTGHRITGMIGGLSPSTPAVNAAAARNKAAVPR